MSPGMRSRGETTVPDPFRVLITGSRTWRDEQTIRNALAAVVFQHDPANVTIVHGACPTGADAIADRIATDWGSGLTVERHPADWERYGRRAGPLRNQHMVDLGADLCLAFQVNGSRGTADCIRRAERAGIPVRRYERAAC